MRRRSQSYQNLIGHAENVSIRWYWRLLAVVASIMVLGGFVMLPLTFNKDPDVRVSRLGLGIFAVAILLAGVCGLALACIVVRDRSFRAIEVFRPALASCMIGFLTVFYNFIVNSSYHWNTAAILTATAAGVGAIISAALLFHASRKANSTSITPLDVDPSIVSRSTAPSISLSRHDSSPGIEEPSRYQTSQYYQNYIRNMFPTATAAQVPIAASSSERATITEEEMQRQQMLMLLLRQEPYSNVKRSSSTFRIEWQSQEQDHETPIAGFYAIPGNDTMNSSSSYSQSQYGSVPSSVSMRVPGGLKPWDGVWRGIEQCPSTHTRPVTREDRRREIEMGA